MEEKEVAVVENKEIEVTPVGDFPSKDLAKIMKASSPYDVILDNLAVMDKYITLPDGTRIRVDRMTHIGNFLTQNIVETVKELDEDGEVIEKEVLNQAHMKALTDFLKLKPKEEEKDNTQQHKLDMIIGMLVSKRGQGSEEIDALISEGLKKINK